MEDQIKQIGQRLKGLREVLDIPAEEVAQLCGVTVEHYMKMEEGEADPSVYRFQKYQNVMALPSMCCSSAKSRA